MPPRKPTKSGSSSPKQGSFDALDFNAPENDALSVSASQTVHFGDSPTEKSPVKNHETTFSEPAEEPVGTSAQKPLTIFQLTTHIKRLLEHDTTLSDVWVQGEISNLVKAASGHAYFTLKDAGATLKAVLWAGNARRVKAVISNGSQVIAHGSLSLYEPRGEYQLVVTDLRPAGLGALFEAFERLKTKLAGEGLFDSDRKVPLPFLPRGVGIVTSPTGAVIKDMFRVIRRRFPNMPIYFIPVKVQGDGAANDIATGIAKLDADPRVDVIIIARGGGSIEDLWAFNEEITARAIANAVKPIISGVGHETDTTISDFVADVRAATPSVAGELVVPLKEDLIRNIFELRNRLRRGLSNRLAAERQRLSHTRSCRFLQRPSLFVAERRMQVANCIRDLETAAREGFRRKRHRFDLIFARLSTLNPRAVLQRGYLLAIGASGTVITSIRQIAAGMDISLHMADGQASAKVIETKPNVVESHKKNEK
ncbi:MAG: exodeoxyribonuclease VII large subunit [Candidatus Riflebacteria bacterium]|nr:exodeoxyribonuclease VII large subunit [Candidatus Riflebacteria bacterium]